MTSTWTAPNRDRQSEADAGVFGNRAFVLLWLASGASIAGGLLSAVVVSGGLDVTEDRGGQRGQTMAICLFMFPFFIFGTLNGLLADRLSRRGLIIGVGLAGAVLMSALVILTTRGPLASPWVFVPLVIGGVSVAMLSPAMAGLLSVLVPRHQLARANAASLALAVVAIVMVVLLGEYLADRRLARTGFAMSAAGFLVSVIFMILLRQPAGRTHRPSFRGEGIGTLAEVANHIRTHRRVMRLIDTTMVVWGCGALLWIAAPILVWDVCGRQDLADVRLSQSFLVAGLLIGAVFLTSAGDALRGEATIRWSLSGVTLAIAVLAAVSWLPISSGVLFWVASAAMAVAGAFFAGAAVGCSMLLQRIVPNRLRGRVFGLTDLAGTASLLAVMGIFGLPDWSNLSGWIGWVLLGVAAVMAGVVARVWSTRLRQEPLPPVTQFFWYLNEFYCKWWFRFRREGPCTVPAEGAVIVVANHTCGVDPLLLIAGTSHRLIGFLVAEEYTHVPIGGRLIHMIGCVPVRRDGHDAAGTRAALRHLRDGNVLGIFIEGGIPEPGESREPKLGAAMLALHTGALIVPAHISGTSYDENIARSFFRRHHARVRFGKPIDLGRYWIPSGDKEALRRVSLKLLERIRRLGPGGEAEDDGPSDLVL